MTAERAAAAAREERGKRRWMRSRSRVERDSGKRKNKRRRKREWLDLIFEHKKSSGRERQRRKDPLRDARGGVLGGLGGRRMESRGVERAK